MVIENQTFWTNSASSSLSSFPSRVLLITSAAWVWVFSVGNISTDLLCRMVMITWELVKVLAQLLTKLINVNEYGFC